VRSAFSIARGVPRPLKLGFPGKGGRPPRRARQGDSPEVPTDRDPTTPEHKEAWGAFYKSLEDPDCPERGDPQGGGEAKEIARPRSPGNMIGTGCELAVQWPHESGGALRDPRRHLNQGWHNRGGGMTYYNNLHSMIRGWRHCVGQAGPAGLFPSVSTCPDQTDKPGIDSNRRDASWHMAGAGYSQRRNGQPDRYRGAHSLPQKAVPGRRLALHALKEPVWPKGRCRGPMFKSYEVKGDKVIVAFDCAEGGLVVADTALNRSREEGATGFARSQGHREWRRQVQLFWLAGEDRVWHPARFGDPRRQGRRSIRCREAAPRRILRFGRDRLPALPLQQGAAADDPVHLLRQRNSHPARRGLTRS